MSLRIAMLGTRGLPATFGGVEHHVEQIGSRLVERGHHVTVYSQSHYSRGERLHEYQGMRVVTLPTVPVRSLEAISHAAMATVHGLFRGHDVFHYHAVGPGLVSPLARFGSRAAVVQTVHGLDAERAKWGGGARGVLNVATWMSAHVPDRTVTVSRSLAEHYSVRYDRPATYVPNGINPKTRREPLLIRQRHGLDGGDYLLFVGRLVPEKRPDLLLKAFAGLDTDKKLVIVGGSSYTDDYVEELRRLAEQDPRVIMPGYVYGAELDELFSNAAGFVQPSALEGLPLTLLEAMGSGLPVVVSDIDPHLEIVEGDRPGARVFADGDAEALRDALGRLLADQAGEDGAAELLRRSTLRSYDWDAAVDALEEIYHAALRRPRRSGASCRRSRGHPRPGPPPPEDVGMTSSIAPSSPTRRVRALIGALSVAIAGLTAVTLAPPASADQNVVVSPTPNPSAPRVMNGRVYAIDSYGPLVAVGGSFTTIRPGASGADQARQWLFMYNSDTGAISQTFVPQLRGPAPAPTNGVVKDQPGVEAIQFAPDGQSLYVGGWFTSANGETHNRLVQLNLDGSVRASFQPNLNNVVSDMALVGNRLVIGGRFGQVNGQPVARLASLDPATGATQTDFNLPATESRNQYASYVNEIDASADGRYLAVSGSFRKIGTATRQQLALIDLSTTRPSVANWSTDLYTPNCSSASTASGSYIRGLSISPDSKFLVVTSTGAYVGADTMCDTAARFELPPTSSGDNLSWTWRAKTGGDTLWSTEITSAAVYVGGHQRWLNNPRPSPGGDNDGPGSVLRPGVAALDPLTGVPLSWNPGRDRGRGAEAMHATDANLFVGHDTDLWNTSGTSIIRQRLAQLPVAGGTANPQPARIDLPVNLYVTEGSTLKRASFNGTTLGPVTTVAGSGGESWSSNRGGFVQDGKLHYFGPTSNFFSRPFSDSTIGAPTNLSRTVGYVDTNYNLTPDDQPYGVAETTAATYANGRIFYLKSGDSRLFYRGYSLESGIVEASEYVASSASFSSARSLNMIGDWLYVGWNDGRLYRYYAPDGQIDLSSSQLVDNGSSINWANVRGFWATPGAGTATPPTPPAPLSCTGATPWKASYFANATLAGSPSVNRCEAGVDYNYGNGAPSGTTLPNDNFSVTWTRTVDLTAPGAIKVDTSTDDGVRAYVDGQRVIDAWVDGSSTRTGTSRALAAGSHTVRVEYYERSGSARAQAQTSIVAAPPPEAEPDNQPGDTTVTTPTPDQTLTSGALTTTGEATDNVGVTEVHVAVYDRNAATNRWLQPNGTWGPSYSARNATLASPGATATTWSLSGITLPQGDFAIDARSFDAAGNEDPDRAWRPFSVRTAGADTVLPTVDITTPTHQQTVTTSRVDGSGTAADNVGVTEVRVGVYNRDGDSTTRWLQDNGSWGPTYTARSATLGTPGATSTTWGLPVTLADGNYAFDVRAVDAAGNVTNPRPWRPFSVSTAPVDRTAPTVDVTSPAKKATVTTHAVSGAGTITDNQAVGEVRVAINDRANPSAPWLQDNGTWGSSYAFRTATLASPGTASSTWNLGITLPDGLYAFDVKGVDEAGNASGSTWHPFVVNAPSADAVAPNAKATSRATRVKGSTVTLKGTATDDKSVRYVLVSVRKKGAPASRAWLQQGKRFGEREVYRLAKLSRAGGKRTDWKLRLRLPRGKYAVSVLAVDRSTNLDRSPGRLRVVVPKR